MTKTIKVSPTRKYKPPYDAADADLALSFEEHLEVSGATAEFLADLGTPLAFGDEKDTNAATRLLEAVKTKNPTNLKDVSTSFAAAAFLREYGQQLAIDVNQVRAALTFKLMELANCGDPKYELRALELLGKHSDISLFTNKSELTINYKNPEDLENAIKERVKRLMNADVIDVEPLGLNLDEELGLGDFAEGEDKGEENDLGS